MTLTRPIAWTVAAAAALTLTVSAVSMGSRVSDYYKKNPPIRFAFMPVGLTEFGFANRPVRVEDTTTKDDAGADVPAIRISYGDDVITLKASIPGHPQLPLLARHEDWFRIVRFADATGTSIDGMLDKIRKGEVPDRLVAVTRTPRLGPRAGVSGAAAESEREQKRRDWTFDFWEFKPSGGFAHQQLNFPTTKRYEQPREGELREDTWQWQAALQVMPSGTAPKYKFTNDGLRAMGWTLPATSGSILALLISLMIAGAPRRRAGASEPRTA
ncbi:MAG: hypothetical protein SFY96_01850 [Planctomycetota bacterium]|nr:hypothetical protein [Planctomycetota bacterium]